MKILFWGNGNFGVPIFEFLVKEYKNVQLITMPAKKRGRGQKVEFNNLVKIAKKEHIPFIIQEDIKEEEFIEKLKEINADINIVVDYGKIIPEKILNEFKDKFINIHPSLLPLYRGATPIQSVLLNGEKETGVTIQKMIFKLDAGDILLQQKINIDDDDNFLSLSKKLTDVSINLVCNVLKNFTNIIPLKQDENKATYCHKFSKEDFTTNWQEEAEKIRNKIRAFSPKPGLKSIFRNKIIKIIEAEIDDSIKKDGEFGEIIFISKKEVIIKTKNKNLKLLKVHPENKKIMDIVDFINGYKPKNGEIFRSVLC